MTKTDNQRETEQKQSLNYSEVGTLAGSVTIVLGTLLPAFNPGIGETQSLAESGRSVAVVLWGLAVAVAWKVVDRKANETTVLGAFCFLLLSAYGIAVWYDEVREPIKTFFGTVQASFRPTAWIVVALGTVLVVTFAQIQSRNRVLKRDVAAAPQTLPAIGAALAILGCLFALAIVNPLSPWHP